LPDSALLAPLAPAAGSRTEARDQEETAAAIKAQGGQRWAQAKRDADLTAPTEIFSCVLGLDLREANIPKTTILVRRALVDLGLSTSGAKQKFKRERPFVVNKAPLCTPEIEAGLRGDGSYPSGHSAIGWGLGLILSEAVPDRTNELLIRARSFGQSRVICNAHWQSDVEEGRIIASAAVAKMHSLPEFRADMEAARAELAALRASGKTAPQARCAVEREGLGAS
jgi:acid phosphatase (class A)